MSKSVESSVRRSRTVSRGSIPAVKPDPTPDRDDVLGLSELKSIVGKLVPAVDNFQKTTEKKFSEVDSRLVAFGDRFTGIEGQLGELTRVVNGLQGQATKLNAIAGTTSERIDNVAAATRSESEIRNLFEQWLKTTQPTPAPTPVPTSESVAKPTPTPEKTEGIGLVTGAGFTGKALVFFIHGADGGIDWTRPFYSPNVAKRYDWHYAIVPAWVQNDKFVRVLDADEAANVVW